MSVPTFLVHLTGSERVDEHSATSFSESVLVRIMTDEQYEMALTEYLVNSGILGRCCEDYARAFTDETDFDSHPIARITFHEDHYNDIKLGAHEVGHILGKEHTRLYKPITMHPWGALRWFDTEKLVPIWREAHAEMKIRQANARKALVDKITAHIAQNLPRLELVLLDGTPPPPNLSTKAESLEQLSEDDSK